ncbi:LuxR C-terminal-related transcriptional regulator [Kitasatospora sp. NPDC048194]|uniref:helix-turn-helix transcriptional regulator n=1 Tax=Kitasatospora sp. NPDC048194 TaxID=3364045 RepID=UPI0037198E88
MTDRSLALLDEAARELYRAILREGGRIRIADIPQQDAETVQALLELGLLKPYLSDGSLSAINPRSVSARIAADLRTAGTRLLVQAEEVPDLLGDLTNAYDAAPRCHDRDRTRTSRVVVGAKDIRHQIARLTEELRSEALCLHPGGARPAEAADDIVDHARRYVASGGALRTVYGASVLTDGPSVRLAARLTELGCHLRVLAVPFTKMMVLDRTVAVIPAAPDASSAAFVEDPIVVDFLVRSFETHWQQAEGVNWAALTDGSNESVTREQVGRLLARGLTQRAIASRMGLSERTVAGHIARLRESYDAETLFQLGWRMRGARTGESGGRAPVGPAQPVAAPVGQ